jgi:hypothetical protein
MLEKSDNELSYSSRIRLDRSQDADKFRVRGNKATRKSGQAKKAGNFGSIRQRRNKHWSW